MKMFEISRDSRAKHAEFKVYCTWKPPFSVDNTHMNQIGSNWGDLKTIFPENWDEIARRSIGEFNRNLVPCLRGFKIEITEGIRVLIFLERL